MPIKLYLNLSPTWAEQAEKYRNGEISKKQYDAWRYNYPKHDKNFECAKVPSQGMSGVYIKILQMDWKMGDNICCLVKQFKCSYLMGIQMVALCVNSQIGMVVYTKFQEMNCPSFHRDVIQKTLEYIFCFKA